VPGFSEQAHGWVKKFIRRSEKGMGKGLASFAPKARADYHQIRKPNYSGTCLHLIGGKNDFDEVPPESCQARQKKHFIRMFNS